MENCLFCKIGAKHIPADVIYEDDDFLAFLDINPINPGHTLLIPKIHIDNLHSYPENLLPTVGPLLKKISNAVKEATSADGINIGMNNGEAAGQEVFHAHIHIIPRYKNDGYKMWHGKPYLSELEKKEISEKIKKGM